MKLNPLARTKKYVLSKQENISEKEKVVFEIENISVQQHEDLRTYVLTKNEKILTEINYEKALIHVLKIENLFVGERKIEKGTDLIGVRAVGLNEIIKEVVRDGVLADEEVES